MIVLGIDPGLATTGYGVIKSLDRKLEVINYGCLLTKSGLPLSARLLTIYQQTKQLILTYKPDIVVIEEIFFCKNVKTALQVGHARGVIMLAASEANTEIAEYTPLQVKQSLTGFGRADKKQIQEMVKILLNLKTIPKPDDAADALAIAICHIHSSKLNYNCSGV
ncbi:MAG: crossover junction endodeoxyribonuclease RuvC [Nitrospirota bacterium]